MGKKKKAKKSIESIKNQIEKHFEKLENDIKEKKIELARYHAKEIDKSLLFDLEVQMRILGEIDKELIEIYRKRLGELEKQMES